MSENLSQLVGQRKLSDKITKTKGFFWEKRFWRYKGNVLRTFWLFVSQKPISFFIFFGTSSKNTFFIPRCLKLVDMKFLHCFWWLLTFSVKAIFYSRTSWTDFCFWFIKAPFSGRSWEDVTARDSLPCDNQRLQWRKVNQTNRSL